MEREGSSLELGAGVALGLFVAWLSAVLAFVFLLLESSEWAHRVVLEPFVSGAHGEAGVLTRSLVAWIVVGAVLLSLICHVGYWVRSALVEKRWQLLVEEIDDLLSSCQGEEAERCAREASPVLRSALESTQDRRHGPSSRDLRWPFACLVLFLLPLALDLVGTASAVGQTPSLGYHGTCLVAAALLAVPTAVSLSLSLTLGPRRRVVAWALAEQIRAASGGER